MAENREKDAQLPKDRSNNPIQVLGHDHESTPAVGTVSGTSARVTIPTSSEIVEVASLTDCHIAFGGSAVDATTISAAFPKGVGVFKILPGQTHLAFILASGASGAKITVTRLK